MKYTDPIVVTLEMDDNHGYHVTRIEGPADASIGHMLMRVVNFVTDTERDVHELRAIANDIDSRARDLDTLLDKMTLKPEVTDAQTDD